MLYIFLTLKGFFFLFNMSNGKEKFNSQDSQADGNKKNHPHFNKVWLGVESLRDRDLSLAVDKTVQTQEPDSGKSKCHQQTVL